MKKRTILVLSILSAAGLALAASHAHRWGPWSAPSCSWGATCGETETPAECQASGHATWVRSKSRTCTVANCYETQTEVLSQGKGRCP